MGVHFRAAQQAWNVVWRDLKARIQMLDAQIKRLGEVQGVRLGRPCRRMGGIRFQGQVQVLQPF